MPDLPPDRLKAMLSQDAEGAAPGAAAPPDMPAGPMASPMSTPEPKQGDREGAMVKLAMALDQIEMAIPDLGAETPEGKQAMAAMRALSGLLGSKRPKVDELQPAAIQQLLGMLPQAGNVTPEVQAMLGPKAGPGPAAPPPAPAAGGAPPPLPQAA